MPIFINTFANISYFMKIAKHGIPRFEINKIIILVLSSIARLVSSMLISSEKIILIRVFKTLCFLLSIYMKCLLDSTVKPQWTVHNQNLKSSSIYI